RPVAAVRDGAVLIVDVGDDLIAQIRVVSAGAVRVDVLASAVSCPAVDAYHDRWRDLPGRERLVDQLEERSAVGRPVCPAGDVPAVAVEQVDRRITPRLVGIARW